MSAFLTDQFARGDAAGWAAGALAAAGLLVLAGGCAWLWRTDVREHLLPGRVVRPLYPVCGGLLGAAALVAGEPVRLLWMLWGLAVMGGIYVLLRLLHPAGMGMGDVRLSGLLGMCLASPRCGTRCSARRPGSCSAVWPGPCWWSRAGPGPGPAWPSARR
ncbi:prepilin peptidase [Kocuria sp. CNJ-770]|uniref:prepilin peptidase n=1 Tax=Kocuria sp. CNJ-770 TaxID=1904964 RepID=UPI002100EEE6|nr:prepilin peptidase [Kocuria sp. CNJ-770]